jgi:hypothetical protein
VSNSDGCLLCGPSLDVIRRKGGARLQRVVRESVKRRSVSAVEEFSLLEAITRERLVKTQQTERI